MLCRIGVNITRVSYNKAINAHTLFIDVDGTPEQLAQADEQLTEIGYLQTDVNDKNIVLLKFQLRDVSDRVTEVLLLINEFDFNTFHTLALRKTIRIISSSI